MSINVHNGTVIVFEGADGTGKSTAMQMLNSYLSREGYSVLCLNVISCSPEGKLFRQEYTTKELDPMLQTVGFLNSNAIAFTRHIFEDINEFDFVLVDRGWASIVAYQLVLANQMYAYSTVEHILQDPRYQSIFNIYLQADPQVALKRIIDSGRPLDTIEGKGVGHQKLVAQGYEKAFTLFPELAPSIRLQTDRLDTNQVSQLLKKAVANLTAQR
jgi:thymidylate kinase